MSDFFTPKKLAFKISDAKRAEKIHCCAYGCKSKPNAKKLGLCHKHYAIYRRIKDPVYDRYVNFKGNALRRGKSFEIKLPEFREWCEKTGYIVSKGMRGKNCTIDRINNNIGYRIDNIQLLTNKANIEKYHKIDKLTDDMPF